MAKIAEVQEVSLSSLVPYERNAKIHGQEQIEKLKASIQAFGFLTPCLIDRENNIIAGHGRVMAAKELGMKTVPCVYIEGLTEEQRRAYILADNRIGELGEWDMDIVFDELTGLESMAFDVSVTGFDAPETAEGFAEWDANRERNDAGYEEGNDEYNEFLDKFENPKTTDDCYTPDIVYDAVADYVAERFGLNRKNFVRPFYPGGDYENEKYKPTDVVVDNPPFSILAQITRFYGEHKIPYFLFAPALTCLSGDNGQRCAICLNVSVIYENKANVSTSFVTNMIPDNVAVTDPELYKKVQEAADKYAETLHAALPKYNFPDEVATAARLGYLSKYGQRLEIPRKEAFRISELDAMKEYGKGIFGGAYLISEKAAAEKAAATTWQLSEREREIVRGLK